MLLSVISVTKYIVSGEEKQSVARASGQDPVSDVTGIFMQGFCSTM